MQLPLGVVDSAEDLTTATSGRQNITMRERFVYSER